MQRQCPSECGHLAHSAGLIEVPISGSFMNVEYEWDEAKAAANLAKHRTSFQAAARGLADPRKVEIVDDRFDYDEERIQTICMDRGRVLFVISVMRGDNRCRIISARKANRREQESYFQGGPLHP
jgi:uncharacterized DUF497 family protein